MTDYNIDACADAVRSHHSGPFPETALILGSGLGRFGDGMDLDTVVDYGDIPGFPVSTVSGHSGRLLIGRSAGLPLICMQGRMHLYEGYDASRLTVPIRTLHRLGVRTLIVTNAAGSLREDMGAGSLMCLEDHINLTGRNPLIGPNDDAFGPRFFDMSVAYDKALREKLANAARSEGIELRSGVYLQLTGPNFETPAEVRMCARLGADAVGMSTVQECLIARHAGMRVLGISLITNQAAGIAKHALSHEETLREGEKASGKMEALLKRFFTDLAAESA